MIQEAVGVCSVPQHLQLIHQEDHRPQQYQYRMTESQNSIQWPSHMAQHVTDAIHQKVHQMLQQSRLVRKTDGIRLVKSSDIFHLRELGRGGFSEVNEVVVGGSAMACKNLKHSLMAEPEQFISAASELIYEAHVLASLDHPHVLKVRGWNENGLAAFDNGRHDSFFLLLDMLDETLDQRIERWNTNGYTSSNIILMDKIRVLNEIASALHYVHQQGIIFRDLKPDNIGFLGDSSQLFDFGLSRELPTLDATTPYCMSGRVGTIRYMAPEVVLNQPYNVSADVYSWSMVAYEVLMGEKPYATFTPELHADYVCKGGMRPNMNGIRHELAILLQQAWTSDPSLRPTLPRIMVQLQQILMKVQAEEQLQQNEYMMFQQQQQQHIVFQQQQHHPAIFIDLTLIDDDSDHTQSMPNHRHHQHRHGAHRNLSTHGPSKLRRCLSSDSIETIETSSMSTDSLDWF